MAKFFFTTMLFATLLTTLPQKLLASKIETTETSNPLNYNNDEAKNSRATLLMNRINEIKALDKSSLSTTEKKELRKELKSIKKEFKKEFKGAYLSVSAIIIIILLLILLV